MDAAPAVSTLHTQGSKAWNGCNTDQEKEREYGVERQRDYIETEGENNRNIVSLSEPFKYPWGNCVL